MRRHREPFRINDLADVLEAIETKKPALLAYSRREAPRGEAALSAAERVRIMRGFEKQHSASNSSEMGGRA